MAISVHAKAQTFKIDTSEITYENKLRPCFNVKYDASPVTVKKAWDKFFDKNYNVKIKGIGFLTNKDIISGTDVTIADISDKRMDIYARITDVAGGSELKYFMSFGYDFFLTLYQELVYPERRQHSGFPYYTLFSTFLITLNTSVFVYLPN